MLRAITAAMDESAEKAKELFEETVETWESKPEFIVMGDGATHRYIYTSSQVYGYLNYGTRVRYATMTPGFVAKTSPKVIKSGAGSGGVHFINKSRPRPGIQARRWDEVISAEMQKEFPKIMQEAINKEIAAMGNE